MTTVTAFINARIDEDEQIARAATLPVYGQPVQGAEWSVTDVPFEGITVWDPQPDLPGHTDARTEHIARHDPARVLRQCAAIREALDSIDTLLGIANNSEGTWGTDAEIARDAIASIWSDHPDFDPRWKI